VLLLAGCAAEARALTPAATAVVDGSGRYQSVLRLDRDGRPHLVFAAGGDRASLRYRTPDGATETVVAFDERARTEFDFAFVFDADERPVVAYEQTGLHLARRTAIGWRHELIDAGERRGYFPALAIAADGVVHVSYFDLANNDLRYATDAGGRWRLEIIDASGRPGFHLAAGFSQITLACQVAPFCQAGRPLIVYLAYRYKPYDGELRAASQSDTGWRIEPIDTARGTGGFPSLGVGQNGVPWVSFYRASSWDFAYGELRVARRTRGGWQKETIDSGTYVGRYQALAMASNDRPLILYAGEHEAATLAALCEGWRLAPLAVASARGWGALAVGEGDTVWATLTSPAAQTVLLELADIGKEEPCL